MLGQGRQKWRNRDLSIRFFLVFWYNNNNIIIIVVVETVFITVFWVLKAQMAGQFYTTLHFVTQIRSLIAARAHANTVAYNSR